jgi:hypothetical protein
MVGSKRDAYAFRLRCDQPGWQTELHDMTGRPTMMLNAAGSAPVATDEWIELSGMSPMILAIMPPNSCRASSIDVQVTQRSTGQVAVVEFSLDPSAAGPGCYVV